MRGTAAIYYHPDEGLDTSGSEFIGRQAAGVLAIACTTILALCLPVTPRRYSKARGGSHLIPAPLAPGTNRSGKTSSCRSCLILFCRQEKWTRCYRSLERLGKAMSTTCSSMCRLDGAVLHTGPWPGLPSLI